MKTQTHFAIARDSQEGHKCLVLDETQATTKHETASEVSAIFGGGTGGLSVAESIRSDSIEQTSIGEGIAGANSCQPGMTSTIEQ